MQLVAAPTRMLDPSIKTSASNESIAKNRFATWIRKRGRCLQSYGITSLTAELYPSTELN